jgi:hypothetical protein
MKVIFVREITIKMTQRRSMLSTPTISMFFNSTLGGLPNIMILITLTTTETNPTKPAKTPKTKPIPHSSTSI